MRASHLTEASRPFLRDDTKHTSEDGFEAECHERELDRHGERATNLVDDRLSGEGVAEVECERVLQEQQILHQERLVQIVFRAAHAAVAERGQEE